MGLTTPLIDTVSLPIGAAEVTVIDMASAYSVFANGGQRIAPYAAVEIANSRGEIIYRHDRDAPPARQIVDPGTIAEMDGMLNQVVEAGTARKAKIEGVDVAGKTGTTNGYKDAWFIGFTGNYVGAIWFGNDDDTSMNNMTGGSLPAATWHEIMAYAHEGIELKPLPGRPLLAQTIAAADRAVETATPRKPGTLSPQGLEALTRIAAALKSDANAKPPKARAKSALAISTQSQPD
jgi:penicillin-binding protein 1A